MSSSRVHNFGAGPAALPVGVLERVRAELLDYGGTGRSILELSHRSPQYDEVHEQARSRLLRLLGAGDEFEVLFMGGGARTQFSLVPMNLLGAGQQAGYLVTGRWSELALAAGERLGGARAVWSGKDEAYSRLPDSGDYEPSSDAAFLHYTSNNTIYGTQFADAPESGGVPLVADMSSDILSRPVDLGRHGLIYAGAQKNLGPAGVTVVLIRRDLLEAARPDLADMMSYRAVAAKRSLLNTPPVFAIYVMNLVLEDLEAEGGLEGAAQRSQAKADLIYGAIERSGGFYLPHAAPGSRSLMNVTFRLAEPELEASFLEEAESQALVGLKGHRSVGGVRASIYNSVATASVEALASFLDDFRLARG
ncbi:MAG: phosphoserine transaminase [Thermoanaerobaculia bacterium]